MDSNVLAVVPRLKVKRLRRCLNPGCPWVVGGGKLPLRSTRVGEYVRLGCDKCGALSVFNPVAAVRPDANRHIFVAWDGRPGKVEHIFPESRVLLP
jgi:hypothetical protein